MSAIPLRNLLRSVTTRSPGHLITKTPRHSQVPPLQTHQVIPLEKKHTTAHWDTPAARQTPPDWPVLPTEAVPCSLFFQVLHRHQKVANCCNQTRGASFTDTCTPSARFACRASGSPARAAHTFIAGESLPAPCCNPSRSQKSFAARSRDGQQKRGMSVRAAVADVDAGAVWNLALPWP